MTSSQMFLKQSSCIHKTEVPIIFDAIQDPRVQERLALPINQFPVKQASAVLMELFRERVTTPAPGESDKEFKTRLRNASRARKPHIKRIQPETQEQFEERMKKMPDVRMRPL